MKFNFKNFFKRIIRWFKPQLEKNFSATTKHFRSRADRRRDWRISWKNFKK